MIPKSTYYAAVHNGVILHKGNKRDILRIVKRNGGNKAGWVLYFTSKPLGTVIVPSKPKENMMNERQAQDLSDKVHTALNLAVLEAVNGRDPLPALAIAQRHFTDLENTLKTALVADLIG